jgi:hypothetical protein
VASMRYMWPCGAAGQERKTDPFFRLGRNLQAVMRFIFCAAAVCAAAALDQPSVTTSSGVINGVAENGAEAFKGIR